MEYETYEVQVYKRGTKFWYQNGKLHRKDGPAVEYVNGTKLWYKNGKCHRDDGPAKECVNGENHWYKNGELHREDGPAITRRNGDKFWALNNVVFSKQVFDMVLAKKKKLCNNKIVEIDGKKYKLQEL